ncbi:MAG: DUF6155 family protein [Bacteroidota bacterium]|nr:DUF6155 family protein [Bacteroidota bacterium]
MSKTALKKHLLSLTKEQVIEQVLGLYDTCKPAKEYFEYFLNPDEQGKFGKYKDVIVNEFFTNTLIGIGKLRFSEAKKAIADFRSLNPSPELLGDLMVTLPEMACKFTNEYGDMSEQFYTSTANNYELALKFLKKRGLLEHFKLRCQDCVKYAEPCGYGFADEIRFLYKDYYE